MRTQTHLIIHRSISETDIDDRLAMSLAGSPPLDILVRTSGVKRLSDFLLWQVRLLLRGLNSRSDCILRPQRRHSCILWKPSGQSLGFEISYPSFWIINARRGIGLDQVYYLTATVIPHISPSPVFELYLIATAIGTKELSRRPPGWRVFQSVRGGC